MDPWSHMSGDFQNDAAFLNAWANPASYAHDANTQQAQAQATMPPPQQQAYAQQQPQQYAQQQPQQAYAQQGYPPQGYGPQNSEVGQAQPNGVPHGAYVADGSGIPPGWGSNIGDWDGQQQAQQPQPQPQQQAQQPQMHHQQPVQMLQGPDGQWYQVPSTEAGQIFIGPDGQPYFVPMQQGLLGNLANIFQSPRGRAFSMFGLAAGAWYWWNKTYGK